VSEIPNKLGVTDCVPEIKPVEYYPDFEGRFVKILNLPFLNKKEILR